MLARILKSRLEHVYTFYCYMTYLKAAPLPPAPHKFRGAEIVFSGWGAYNRGLPDSLSGLEAQKPGFPRFVGDLDAQKWGFG